MIKINKIINLSIAATSLAALCTACGGPSQDSLSQTASPAQPVLSFEQFVKLEATGSGLSSTPATTTAPPSRTDGTDSAAKPAAPQPTQSSKQTPSAPTAATDPDCTGTCPRLRQEFRYVVYVGKQIYAYQALKEAETKTDYAALAASLERSIVTKTSPTQYFLILQRWGASFHDGHVGAFYKDDTSDFEVYSAPVRLEVLAPATEREKIVITQRSEEFGLEPGDEVTHINGVPAKAALDAAEKLSSGSTARMRRASAARLLVDAYGRDQGATPLKLIAKRDEESGDIELFRKVELRASGSSDATDPEEETGLKYIQAKMMPGGIGYLRINAFAGSQSAALLGNAMKMLSGSRGLLIDVRRNGGGDVSGNAILSRISGGAAITRYRTSIRVSDYVLAHRPDSFNLGWNPGDAFSAWKDERVFASADDLYTGKTVAVLTGPDCFSSCDTFVSAIQVNRLGTILGEPTGGGTGQPLAFTLPVSQMQFRYSVVRGQTADDRPIEGVGTLPDVVIERTLQERAQEIDVQLLEATQWVRKQVDEATKPISSKPAAALDEQTKVFVKKLPRSWKQDMKLSPTRAADRYLKRISPVDELDVAGQ
jgi:C-terminal processing protease CtpA/Prc